LKIQLVIRFFFDIVTFLYQPIYFLIYTGVTDILPNLSNMISVKNRTVQFYIFFLLLLFTSIPTLAQTETDTLSVELDTIYVQAVRSAISADKAPLSYSANRRSKQEVAGSAATSISSITQELPGIWANDRQNYALGERITIRGIGWRAAFGVRGIQVILDGIPLTVADGQSVTNLIDPAFIKRAELIRGPAGTFWGNSSGGVLYLSTKPDYNSSNNFNARTQGGSFGYRKAELKYHQSFGRHNVNTYTSYQFNNGFRNYSSSKLLRSGIQGSYRLSAKSHIEYTGALLAMPQAQHPSSLTAEQASENPQQANDSFVASGAGKEVTQGQLGLSYYRDTSAGLITLTGHGIYRDLSNPLPFGIITVDRLAGGLRSTIEKQLGNLRINAGAELKLQHDDRVEFKNEDGNRGAVTVNQVEKVRNEALFLTSTYTLGKINLLGGLRYDRLTFSSDSASSINTGERTFQAFSPSIGLSYNTGPITLFSNLSTSFEAPTTTELVNRPDGGNGFNPNLKPERTIGFELGSRGTVYEDFLEYDVTFYQLWIQDLLFPFQLENNGPVFFRNQGETRHRGIEVAATVNPINSFSLKTAYTLTNAEFVQAQTLDSLSLKGNNVPGVPKHRISTSLSWSPSPFWMQLNTQYVNSFAVNNGNTAFNERYLNVDAKISYTQKFNDSGITLIPFININNIFNTRYNSSVVVNAFGGRYFEPAPGRNWQAGASINF
jgi:iron complex outermembrane receptor protein